MWNPLHSSCSCSAEHKSQLAMAMAQDDWPSKSYSWCSMGGGGSLSHPFNSKALLLVVAASCIVAFLL